MEAPGAQSYLVSSKQSQAGPWPRGPYTPPGKTNIPGVTMNGVSPEMGEPVAFIKLMMKRT